MKIDKPMKKTNRDTPIEEKTKVEDFKWGLYSGLPILLGYIPVSFTFGFLAVQGGLPVWTAVLISMTNLTSAGQFAGTNLIFANASLFEIGFTTFIINIRYMLMSLSLSQKLKPGISLLKRSAIAFGITDEVFAVSSLEKREITPPYMAGLILGPVFGWVFGTWLGASTTSLMSPVLQDSMGIALYGMFISLIIPTAKHSMAVTIVILVAVVISSIFTWIPLLNQLSSGWVIIIAAVVASGLGAILFPRKDDEDGSE